MEIREAFTIERPAVSVPWGITAAELNALIPDLRRVTHVYYTLPVTVLGGLRCMLGFHLRGDGGGLSELEFFRTAYPDQRASFEEFQQHFERTFGPPSSSEPGGEGLPSYEWRLPGVSIIHYVFDRFGPEEHMRIRRAA
ncbi:MAG: hypothetical protein JRF15_13625 [Deltaproteobacteria bacterium]|jgi:hypothetical protein|nr:hypothetical protein [Deltaproteobacteria bacterium]